MSLFHASFLQPGTVLLDTAYADAENRQGLLLFRGPSRVLTARTLDEVNAVLEELDAATRQGYYVAGYLAYEAGYALETIAPLPAEALLLAWFGVYDAPAVPDEAAFMQPEDEDASAGSFVLGNVRFGMSKAAYVDRVQAVKHYIREGDVYQINFTDRVTFDFEGSSWALYQALRRRQRVPYGAFIHTGTAHVLSLSPELFFRRGGDRLVTRPMKGTVRRGRTLDEDDALRRWLASDPKNRAENLMIVDLLRNDLSRCCRPGTVRVPDLFTTEPYETLIQMTSTVEGRLRDGCGYAGIFRALFPCGSVTGAPKIRAMQRISELETAPRGVYCGAIGYAAPDDRAVFNVAIRTVVLEGERGVMGTGSGIVWDSDPEAEHDESRLKARFLIEAGQAAVPRPAFQLIETMRAEDGRVPLLDGHVDRLRASAAYFGYPFDEAAFRKQVSEAAAPSPGQPHKVRVLLDAAGRLTVTALPLDEPFAGYRRVFVSERRVDRDDAFFFHKTTRRVLYESEYRHARAAGFDEVLFLNEQGEVTEGSRTNVFVLIDDALYTPPVASGLLGGVYRRHVLDIFPNASECVLRLKDILTADALYLCNAVRGLQRVEEVVEPVSPEPV